MRIDTLNKKSEFSSMFSSGKVFVSNIFVAYFILKNELGTVEIQNFRFGFIIRKKIGNAVKRNKIKRRLKNLILLNFLKDQSITFSAHIVFVAREKIVSTSFDDIANQMNFLKKYIANSIR